MSESRYPSITIVDEPDTGAAASVVVFVDGPLHGKRQELADVPPEFLVAGGLYRRSVRCADDGAMRYVFAALQDDSRAVGSPTPRP
jgi:hypothetical protein